MSLFRAFAATTGMTPDPPFLPPLEGAPAEVVIVAPPLGQRYQAPIANKATTGSHSHRMPERRGFAGFASGDAAGVRLSPGPALSSVGGVYFSMCPSLEVLVRFAIPPERMASAIERVPDFNNSMGELQEGRCY